MAKEVSVGEAKAKLSSLINAVAYGGERVVIQSRGRPKAALVSVEDLRRLEGVRPVRPSTPQRALALAQADRVRQALEGFKLTDSVEELARIREERLRGLR
ncbi:MAG: type II toxin-antitoxin system Phd/YefM family antitoxin [Candidatus Rokubacteria bacterium]|nr:type II toxin-antitoxin system Phd/YefM family antitoxin [Candidatus Rokubacteria bacterium]